MLPSSWVDSLFARLAVRYGSSWLSKWHGIDIAAVKADWAEELGGFVNNPDAITYALAHLPRDFPPSVDQFRQLCCARPEPAMKLLPAPVASEEVVAAAVSKVKAAGLGAPMNKQWAYSLRDKEQQGVPLGAHQRAMWRAALGEVAR